MPNDPSPVSKGLQFLIQERRSLEKVLESDPGNVRFQRLHSLLLTVERSEAEAGRGAAGGAPAAGVASASAPGAAVSSRGPSVSVSAAMPAVGTSPARAPATTMPAVSAWLADAPAAGPAFTVDLPEEKPPEAARKPARPRALPRARESIARRLRALDLLGQVQGFMGWARRSLWYAMRLAPLLLALLALFAGGWTVARHGAAIEGGLEQLVAVWRTPPRPRPVFRTFPPVKPLPPTAAGAAAPPPSAARHAPSSSSAAPQLHARVATASAPSPPRSPQPRPAEPAPAPAAPAVTTPAPAVPARPIPWVLPAWGTRADDVVSSLPPGTGRPVTEPRRGEGGLLAGVDASKVRVASGTYNASYLFDPAGALAAVQLRASQRRSAAAVLDELSAWLSASYGQPRETNELPADGAIQRQWIWNDAETLVSLELRRPARPPASPVLVVDFGTGAVRAADSDAVVLTYSRATTP